MRDVFLEEYSSQDAVLKYSKKTAGEGISYLLAHDYGRIYLRAAQACIPESSRARGVRVLEFGCGAGMNLIFLVSLLERQGFVVECAYGTDFSETLITTARAEAERYLPAALRDKVHFGVARNETLRQDLAAAFGPEVSPPDGSLHLVIGVNTMRYCHRLGKQNDCASDLIQLLGAGGASVMIDMNPGFPLYRSRLRDMASKSRKDYYLPPLDKYVEGFTAAGFEILEARTFSWIPHSAGRLRLAMMKGLAPLLDRVAPGHAMRCLVVARKPVD